MNFPGGYVFLSIKLDYKGYISQSEATIHLYHGWVVSTLFPTIRSSINQSQSFIYGYMPVSNIYDDPSIDNLDCRTFYVMGRVGECYGMGSDNSGYFINR